MPNETTSRPMRPMGRGPGMRGGGEKAKDFKGTWIKLLKSMRRSTWMIVLCVIFAIVGSIFTIIGPDRLSSITDEITVGISVDSDLLTEISTEVAENVANGEISELVIDNDGTEVTISVEDQMAMLEVMNNTMSSTEVADGEEADVTALLAAIDELPESIHDLIVPSVNMDNVVKTATLLIILYLASYVLTTLTGLMMATITQRLTRQMRTDISHKINRVPMGYFHKTTTGDILSRTTNDVDTLNQSIGRSIQTLVTQIVMFLASLIMMIKTNLLMTLTAFVATLIGFVLMMIIMSRSQKYFRRQQRHLGEINGHVEEIYSNHIAVKAYNGEDEAQETFDKLNENLRGSAFRAQFLSGLMMPIMTFIGNFAYVAVCIVGAALAINGSITFGVIVAFMIYVRYFTQPLSQIAMSMQQMQSAAAAGERIFEFLEADEMEDESYKTTTLDKAKGNVTFEHVRFGYDPEKVIIHDFSMESKPGQKIAIVGPTGAGKSTIINTLMRFYEIQSGKIMIDGINTADLKREDVHKQFCMVLQDTWLFEGTIRENLIYCEEGVSDEDMKRAVKAVGLDHFVRTLPHGYDTVLSDQTALSQGQKQQLTIARAMISDRPMLILDEATSSVDTRTELLIQDAMDKLMENRTSFVVAHRLSTIKNADLILVLKDGDVIESGTHDTLLAKNGFYAELWNSQFDQSALD